MLYDYLVEHYEEGEPILSVDIEIDYLSKGNLRQQLKQLTDMGKIMRYDNGVYYLPKMSRLNIPIGPTADKVARCKYISRGGRVDGFYSGHTFANQLGISTQVPRKTEIVSNNMGAKIREIRIGGQSFIVRHSNVTITKENYIVLQLLELLKNLEHYADEYDDDVRKRLAEYVSENQIKRADIDAYIHFFPDATYRYFYESRLEYVLV